MIYLFKVSLFVNRLLLNNTTVPHFEGLSLENDDLCHHGTTGTTVVSGLTRSC